MRKKRAREEEGGEVCMTDLYESAGRYGSGRRKLIVNLAPVRQNLCIPKKVINRSAPNVRLGLPSAPLWQLVFFHFSLGKKHTSARCPSALSPFSALLSCLVFLLKDPVVAVHARLAYSAAPASQCSHYINLSNRGVCKDGESHMPL